MMNPTKCLLTILSCIAAMSSGCGNTASENVKSGGISAQIVVKADGSGKTNVNTILNVGASAFGTTLSLSKGDVLKATANGTTQVLSKSTSILGDVSYETTFGFDATGTEFVVSLERSQDTSCPDSRVQLPAPFTITQPSIGQAFSRQANVTLSWTPPAAVTGSIDVRYTTHCIATDGSTVSGPGSFSQPDTGSATFAAAKLLPSPDQPYDQTKPCSSEIEFTRTIGGKLDPNYGEGGRVTGSQNRKVSIVIRD